MDNSLVINVVLLVMFALVAGVAVVQLVRMVIYRHNVLSFQFAFLVLCSLSTIMRFCGLTFRAFDKNIPKSMEFFTDELLLFFQLATFSFLVVFLSSVLASSWIRMQRVYIACWVLFNVSLLCVECILFWTGKEARDKGWDILYCVVYFVLGTFVAILGFRLVVLARSHGHATAPELQQRWWGEILVLCLGLSLSFLSRGVYDAVASTGRWALFYPPFTMSVFACMCGWEILPVVLVVLFFRKIPRPSSLTKKWMTHNAALISNPDTQLSEPSASQLFENPLRYDSDVEDGPSRLDPRYPQLGSSLSPARPRPPSWDIGSAYIALPEDGITASFSPASHNPLFVQQSGIGGGLLVPSLPSPSAIHHPPISGFSSSSSNRTSHDSSDVLRLQTQQQHVQHQQEHQQQQQQQDTSAMFSQPLRSSGGKQVK